MNCSHRACLLGDLDICRLLHCYKVNWESRDKEGLTPLHYATQTDNLDLIKFLVEEAEVDINPKDCQHRTPLYFACR